MKDWLKTLFAKESFDPSVLGLLINHFYIVRRGLLKGIKLLSKDLSGGRLLDVGCGSKPSRSELGCDSKEGVVRCGGIRRRNAGGVRDWRVF